MATELEIKSVARRQLTQEGIPEVTLRAIAREMGITAPALYRYFPSLNDLVEAMRQDLFREITESILAAVATSNGDSGLSLQVAIRTFRTWAVSNPNEFMLMFRKDDTLVGDGQLMGRLAALFFSLYLKLWAEHPFQVPELTATSAATCSLARRFVDMSIGAGDPLELPTLPPMLPPAALFVFARTWFRLYGSISMEVAGQLTFIFDDGTAYFESELEDAAHVLGVEYLPPPGD